MDRAAEGGILMGGKFHETFTAECLPPSQYTLLYWASLILVFLNSRLGCPAPEDPAVVGSSVAAASSVMRVIRGEDGDSCRGFRCLFRLLGMMRCIRSTPYGGLILGGSSKRLGEATRGTSYCVVIITHTRLVICVQSTSVRDQYRVIPF